MYLTETVLLPELAFGMSLSWPHVHLPLSSIVEPLLFGML